MSKTSVSPIEMQEKEAGGSAAASMKPITTAEDEEERRNSVKIGGWKFPFKWFHLLTMIGWVIMIGFMIYYIIRQAMSYSEALGKPTTSMSWESTLKLALPAIT